MKYMISKWEKTNNHPIHVVHTYLESFILFNGEFSTSSKVLIEEKAENYEFSNSILEMENEKIHENMPSGLEPSSSSQETYFFSTTELSQAPNKF